MAGSSRGRGAGAGRWVLSAALAGLACAGARAAEVQTRDFTATVAGKRAGDVHMTIRKLNDGSWQMKCDTDIKVSNLVMTYKYFYRGVEQWKDGRLVKFESNTDDNGKRYVVTAAAEKDGLRVRVNNVERMAKAESWLSSYWCLPDPKLRNGPIPVIDADTGKDVSGRLQFVATEQRPVCGRVINVNHYRLTGKTTIDLWYDGSDRLVRQEWVEQGHRTVLELAGVRQ